MNIKKAIKSMYPKGTKIIFNEENYVVESNIGEIITVQKAKQDSTQKEDIHVVLGKDRFSIDQKYVHGDLIRVIVVEGNGEIKIKTVSNNIELLGHIIHDQNYDTELIEEQTCRIYYYMDCCDEYIQVNPTTYNGEEMLGTYLFTGTEKDTMNDISLTDKQIETIVAKLEKKDS